MKADVQNNVINKKINSSENIGINSSIIAEEQIQTEETNKIKQTMHSKQDFMSSKIPNSNDSTFSRSVMDYIKKNTHILKNRYRITYDL